MTSTQSTTAPKCQYCGGELKTLDLVMFGKPKTVECFGSCGCEESARILERYGPAWREPVQSTHRCPMCGATMGIDNLTGYVADCPQCGYSCVFKSDLDAHVEFKRAQELMRREEPLDGTGVPRLYWSVKPDFNAADRIISTGKGLYIVGGNGTLKTLRAAAVSKAFAEYGKVVRFVSSVKLLSAFKDGYGQNRPEGEVFDELNGCDLLVIDDMGKENPTSWAATMLYAVVDGRYGEMKPIVVTTNYREGELVARLSKSLDDSTARAIVSRLTEMTECVVLDGPDRRLQ